MSNELQPTPEQTYFLTKREEVNNVLILPTKSFLQKTYEFKKLSEHKKDPHFIFLIGGWIIQTCFLMQIKNPVETYVKQDIVNMLSGFWGNLSFEEIIKAFELERHGVYKERTEHFQLFDCNYISQILKKYQNWKREGKTEHNISSSQNQQASSISLEEQKKIMDSAIMRMYNEFLESGEVSIPCSYIFDELYYREVLKASEYKFEFYRKIAERDVKNQVKSIAAVDKTEYNSVKETIQDIEKNHKHEKVLAYAKRLVLYDFFKKIKDENLDINLIIS